jgi:hypothetical protein
MRYATNQSLRIISIYRRTATSSVGRLRPPAWIGGLLPGNNIKGSNDLADGARITCGTAGAAFARRLQAEAPRAASFRNPVHAA